MPHRPVRDVARGATMLTALIIVPPWAAIIGAGLCVLVGVPLLVGQAIHLGSDE